MKILIVTMLSIDLLHPRTYIFKKIIESLRKQTPVNENWILCLPKKNTETHESNLHIYDIHNFTNGYDIVKKINPDVILVDSDSEPIQYSITLAAKKLNIPVISRPPIQSNFLKFVNTRYSSKIRNFFSSEIPFDATQKKFLKRGSFFIYKIIFLIKTKFSINKNFFKTTCFILIYLYNIVFTKKQNPLNLNINLHLLADAHQISDYEKFGINRSHLKLVGNIWLDRIFNLVTDNEKNSEKPKKILVITTALYEHGFWTYAQRNDFFLNFFTILKNQKDFLISLKIHPTTEKIDFYEKLLNSINFQIPVFQSENLLDLIPNYDLFITFGPTNALSDLAIFQKRIINFPFTFDIDSKSLVTEAMSSGFLKKCNSLDSLQSLIIELINLIPNPNKDYVNKRNELFYNNDGKSAERAACAIIDYCKDS